MENSWKKELNYPNIQINNNQLTTFDIVRFFAPHTADVERLGILQTAFATGRINDLNNIFVEFLFRLMRMELERNEIQSKVQMNESLVNILTMKKKIYFRTVKICQTLGLGQCEQGSINSFLNELRRWKSTT